jgi:uncharacterized protein (TIGR02677 family)
MGRFTAILLAEWSPEELVAQGLDLPVETLAARCRFLADKGNLVVSPREVKVTSIAEYHSQPVRYTVSALGARLHREVEGFLAATGGAREVPRELLALVADGLARLDPTSDPETLAGSVVTIFAQFDQFSRSVTDFYTYVGSVLARSDLDGEEWAGFKRLLLDYLDSIVESVRRHAPAITASLERLRPDLPLLLERARQSDPAFAALESSSPGGEGAERSRGRNEADWDQLHSWFAGPGARQLRDAAQQAVGTLLVSLKRINASATREASLRRHFLKLAAWFDASPPELCHAIAASAFGLYGARHLGALLDDELAETVPASASWWTSPRAPVAVSLRERGERVIRGRTAIAHDHQVQRERLVAERRLEAERRAAACAELLAIGHELGTAQLSAPAMRVLLELLAVAASTGSATLSDHPVGLVAAPADGVFVLHSAMGDLSIEGMSLQFAPAGALGALEQPEAVRAG